MKYTESKIKKASANRYMNQDQLDFFRERLIIMKDELRIHLENERTQLGQQSRECDDLDRAQIEEEIHLRLRILDRESKLLPKIDEAIKRIDDGSYGYCRNTGEAIGIERLLVRPTALFSAEEKNRQEKIEKAYRDS
ncbi:MAG: RNA polymerase-binding protein DksA [Gammaproteobacteria bacterium]|jgi:DnaK suppressor protein|nr:RNA polymerase-binding protein DksA [Gammaproteobacteria bacterium]MBT7603671.1 RNA polymerase-binding protein DksA [Gammaproteobacteria bacterium]